VSQLCVSLNEMRKGKGERDGGKDLDMPVDRRETPSVLSRTPLSERTRGCVMTSPSANHAPKLLFCPVWMYFLLKLQ